MEEGEVRSISWLIERIDVAASMRRRVSRKLARRSGQRDWKSVMSITALSFPSFEASLVVMSETSSRISASKTGSARMLTSNQNEVGAELVVER